MKMRGFFWYGLVLLVSLAFSQSEQIVTVTGMGNSRQAAFNDALRLAIEQVIGTFIDSSSLVENYELVRDHVFKRSSGFARVHRILEEGKKDGVYVVKAQVAVSRGAIEDELRALLVRKGDPRILILIPEVVLRRPVPDPAAETELTRALVEAGYRVVDMQQIERLNSREMILHSLKRANTREMVQIAQRFNADILITGEAFAQEVTNPPPALVKAGLRSYQARLEIKAIDVATGQIFYSNAYTAGGAQIADATAAKTAIQNAARIAVKELPEVLARWIANAGKTAARAYVIRVSGFKKFQTYRKLLDKLRALGGVSEVVSRQYSSVSSEIEVVFDGSPEDFAILLEEIGLRVTGLSTGEIRAEYVGE